MEDIFVKAAEKLALRAVDATLKTFGNLVFHEKGKHKLDVEEPLTHHINYITNWASTFQLYWLSGIQPIEGKTTPLGMSQSTFARTLRSKATSQETSEEILLEDGHQHFLIQGIPGSGKTTTLKRLALRILLDNSVVEERFQYPVLIRLRDLPHRDIVSIPKREDRISAQRLLQNWSLLKALARLFHLEYEDRQEKDLSTGQVSRIDTICWNQPIQILLPQILEKLNIVILLDGLDEVHPNEVGFVIEEIDFLTRHLAKSRVVLTSRTGANVRSVEGMQVFTIDPLNREKMEEIASFWLSDTTEFFENLDTEPYSEVADRPLILLQLIYVFDRYGYLPDRPALAYRQSVQMLNRDWDASQKIIRKSRFARSFNPDQKFEFLCHLAHDLFYRSGQITFTRDDLVSAYRAIHKAYLLPKNEAEDVADELETHTGLILKAGFDRYEFSHLSLQEYLAAEHIIKGPIGPRLKDYLRDFPSVVAVAVGLSSIPSEWLPRLLFDNSLANAFSPKSAEDFLKRLGVESPRFTNSIALSAALLVLADIFFLRGSESLKEEFRRLFSVPVVEKSTDELLTLYVTNGSDLVEKDYMHLTVKGPEANRLLQSYRFDTGIQIPQRIRIPSDLVHFFINKGKVILTEVAGTRIVTTENENTQKEAGLYKTDWYSHAVD